MGDTGRVLLGFFLALGIGIILKAEVRSIGRALPEWPLTLTLSPCLCLLLHSPVGSASLFLQEVDDEDLYRIINMPGMLWLNGLKLCVLPLIGASLCACVCA